MSKQTINVGSAANDGTGTPTRTAFQYVNANFTELYNAVGGSNGTIPSAIPISKGGTGATTASEARSNLGLGTASQGTVTTTALDVNVGRLAKVGDFGLGKRAIEVTEAEIPNYNGFIRNIYGVSGSLPGYTLGLSVQNEQGTSVFQLLGDPAKNTAYIRWLHSVSTSTNWVVKELLHKGNTTTDGNGFIKAASPIVQLFSDKIELNDEAKLQDITFEKLDVGDYVIKGSTGFAQEGWYVEMPKDANGNVLVAVVYEQLENKDISVKTYKKKFDIETASIVADLTQPVDIPEGRWIDLRLQELPQEVIDEP